MPNVVAQVGLVDLLSACPGQVFLRLANVAWVVRGAAPCDVCGDSFVTVLEADRISGRRFVVQWTAWQFGAHTAVAAMTAIFPIAARTVIIASTHWADA